MTDKFGKDRIRETLLEAGSLAMRYFQNTEPRWKDGHSLVTEADLEVQKRLVKWLREEYPDDGIIAEEQNVRIATKKGSRYWTVDPIDGTSSFVGGFPVWGIGLGLLEDGKPRGGYFYLPTTEEYYSCCPDSGVRYNGRPAAMKDPDILHPGTLLLTISRQHQHLVPSSRYRGKVRSLGSTIGSMCFVATGRADAALLGRVWLWDLLPGWALLRKNGGILKYLGGPRVTIQSLLKNHRATDLILAGHPDMVRRYETMLLRLGPLNK